MLNFENLNKCIFEGVGKYQIPQIFPVCEYPGGDFIPMNYASRIIDTRNSVSFESIVKVAAIEQKTGEISKILKNKKKKT